MGIVNKVLISLLKFYKKFISPVWKTSCIFTPTCSIYAIEALQKHNFFVGSFLIVRRILRCNSFNKGGFDPVPDSFGKKKWLL
ncbi:MAG TPA: membrane protein insertion efficiency factor YidD [Clostridiales bacterium]|nr:membrane protein insertion efficiency factor YidD [Clostridiales bacterium]